MAMSQRRRFILAGAFFYVFFLLGWLPAEVVAHLVAERSNKTVFLVDPKGTAWDGSASRVVIASSAEQVGIEQVRWHARLDRLVRGEMAAQVQMSERSSALIVTTPRSITLEDARLSVPANLLAVLAPNLSIWRPSGEFEIDTAGFTIGSDGAKGRATLVWQHAGTSLSRVQPLGDYAASVDGNNKAVDFVVSTLRGPLQISGQGTWRSKSDWQFNGQARATEGKQAALDDLLKLFSRRKDGDNYLLQFASNAAR